MSNWRRQAERRAEREVDELERAERRHREQTECTHVDSAPSRWDFSTGEVIEMQCNDCGKTNHIDRAEGV